MAESSRSRTDEAEETPTFVEEGFFSGARIGEAIDWCLVRHDRELHCEVEGIHRETEQKVKLRGRILNVKKGVLVRRIAVLVEEDLRRKKGGDLDKVVSFLSLKQSRMGRQRIALP